MTTPPEPYEAPAIQQGYVELNTDPPSVRDFGLSWLRTVVPVVWGFLLTFLATRFPVVHALVLDNPHVYAVFEGLVTVLWYSLWRGLEGKLPAFLTRLLLGSNAQPTYIQPLPLARSAEDEIR